MDEDYILSQINEWENDLINAYGETPDKPNKVSINQNIISKLIAFSKLSQIRSFRRDEHTKILLN